MLNMSSALALNWSKKWPPVQEAPDRISNVVEDLAGLFGVPGEKRSEVSDETTLYLANRIR